MVRVPRGLRVPWELTGPPPRILMLVAKAVPVVAAVLVIYVAAVERDLQDSRDRSS